MASKWRAKIEAATQRPVEKNPKKNQRKTSYGADMISATLKARSLMVDQEKLNDQLLKAAQEGDLAALEQLLADGADGKAEESRALSLAAEGGHEQCVRLLMAVSDPKAMGSCALQRAAQHGHADCVKLLIPASDPLADDSLALRFAAQEGHAECVALLLPVSDPLAVGGDGQDVVGVARAMGHVEVAAMIEAFIEAKALSNFAQHSKSNSRFKSTL
jgi:ankyrin repeat protein